MTRKINALLSIIMTLAVVLVIGATASYAATVQSATGKVNTPGDKLNLRKSAKSSSALVDSLPDNTKLTIKSVVFESKTSTSSSKKWYKVSVNGKSGYVNAKYVDGIKYTAVDAEVTKKVTYRKGAGTKMASVGTLKKGTKVQVLLKATPVSSTKGSSSTWYMIKYKNRKYYACSAYFKLIDLPEPDPTPTPTPTPEEKFKADLEKQGFDSTYVDKLMELHKLHPLWGFKAYKTGLNWDEVVGKLNQDKKSLIHSSYPKSYRSKDSKSYKNGEYIVKEGSGSNSWYNAHKDVVSYYLDPRNFLDETRMFMFEELGYDSGYQTLKVVNRVLEPTKLPECGFTGELFVAAGKEYKISPVHLASRARQETGSGSDCISGTKVNGVVVYNPFNFGAGTVANPVQNALNYAYEIQKDSKGNITKERWDTQEKAVKGSAKMLAENYISKKQNTTYFQKFNVCNGLSNVATHQYMTNVRAPYSESSTTMTSYLTFDVLDESFTFIIPIYENMPASTKLPS